MSRDPQRHSSTVPVRLAIAASAALTLLLLFSVPASYAGPWSAPQALPGGHHEQLFTDGNGGGIYLYVDGSESCWRLHIYRRSSTPEPWSPAPAPSECIKTSNAIGHSGPGEQVLLSYATPKDVGNPEGPWVLKLYRLATPTAPLPPPIVWEPPPEMPLTPGNAIVDNGEIAYRSIPALDDEGVPHVFWSTPVERPPGFARSGIGWTFLDGSSWAAPTLLPGDTTWDYDVSNSALAAVPNGVPGQLVFLADAADYSDERTEHLHTVAAGAIPTEQAVEFASPGNTVYVSSLVGGEAGAQLLAAVGGSASMQDPFGGWALWEASLSPGQPPALRSPGPYRLGPTDLEVLPGGDTVAAWVNTASPADPTFTFWLHTTRRAAGGPFGTLQTYSAGRSVSVSSPQLDQDSHGRVLLTYSDHNADEEEELEALVSEPGQLFPPMVAAVPFGRSDGACQRTQVGGVIDDFGRVTVITREANVVNPIPERNFSFTAQLPLESADNLRHRAAIPCTAPSLLRSTEIRRHGGRSGRKRPLVQVGVRLRFSSAVTARPLRASLAYRRNGKRRQFTVPLKRVELKRSHAGRGVLLTARLPGRFRTPSRVAKSVSARFGVVVVARDTSCGKSRRVGRSVRLFGR